ncbi:TrbG/VirB9 family P-type conjugative transfer protein [Rhizobium leguminosarum]|uniref:TrbG/VirB9 family P-type conjugative transfer protein n=1 Tax=Rhizobium leguminosarum TaxID=384 RepID=UPI001C970EE3|nr:TrbG/VirB9 family P-type conjugative transfer protein [Rhizobium leguminosarum]MBY5775216.1 TrbG/VirB9 family P-type conjugative transfer protein [Rhizobium leguminosarum]
MIRFLIPIFCLCSLSYPVCAEQAPVGFAADIRIKRYMYDQNNVYKLNLYLKSVTALQFETGENVESILIGDSASWEVVKLKMGNVISLKPIIDNALTNMTIYTDKRVYTFELFSAGEMKAGVTAGADQSFRTVFTYPEKFTAMEKSVTKGTLINSNYMVSGQAPFRPVAVHDNSLQTTFVLPKGAPRPAVYRVAQDRQEMLINSRTDGDRIIVDGTDDFWVMRIGDQTVCIGRSDVSQNPQARRKQAGNAKRTP